MDTTMCYIHLVKWFLIAQCFLPLTATSNQRSAENRYENNLQVVLSYKDLKMDELYLPFTSNYTTLLFINETLYVGARNYLLSLDLTANGLQIIKNESWIPAASSSQMSCINAGHQKEECYNFIKVLAVFDDKLLCCGTNSHYPKCTWRNLSNLEIVAGSNPFFGKGFVPFSPYAKSAYTFSDDGRLFSGAATQMGDSEKTIMAGEFQNFQRSRKLTLEDNVFWLDDPVFHRSFLIGEYIYFFFDEFARECIDCDAVRYSRIGRVCQGDNGGNDMVLSRNLVTFQKARLNCSLPGPYPFHFNVLSDVYWDSDWKTFHGIFTTETSQSIHASAMCSYSLQDIENVFNGEFKIKLKRQPVWETRPNPGHIVQCKVSPKSVRRISNPTGRMNTKYLTLSSLQQQRLFILTSQTVQPRQDTLPFYMENIRFVNIEELRFPNTNGTDNVEVWYIATDHGTILKLSNLPQSKTFCLFEEYNIFPENKIEHINGMKLSPNKEYLLIGSDSKLTKLPLLRCHSYISKSSCLEAKDPLCGWSLTQQECISWKKRTKSIYWIQNITSCPERLAKWSEWSPWSICERQDKNLCQCRRRTCLYERTSYKCNGADIELKNCTVDMSTLVDKNDWFNNGAVHGGWSLWTRWSKCFRGFKNRSRTCSNPSPRNGGLKCKDSSQEYALCEPVHFDGNVTYLWTSWSRVRGPERKARRYKISCTSKAVVMKSLQLDVVDNETVDCNEELCIDPSLEVDHRLITNWAAWLSCNDTIDKFRTRQLCIRNGPNQWSCDQQQIETKEIPFPTISSISKSSSVSSTLSSTVSSSSVITSSMSSYTNITNFSFTSSSSITTTNTTNKTRRTSLPTNPSSTVKTSLTGLTSVDSTSSTSSASSTVMCTPSITTTANPTTIDNPVTDLLPLAKWSRCICDHDVTLRNESLGIQHITMLEKGMVVHKYRTCFCPGLKKANHDSSDVKHLVNDHDSQSARYSLQIVLIMVIVCCFVCILVTSVLLTIIYRKKQPTTKSRDNSNNNRKNSKQSLSIGGFSQDKPSEGYV